MGVKFSLMFVRQHLLAQFFFLRSSLFPAFHARNTLTISYNWAVEDHSLYFWVACAFTSTAIMLLRQLLLFTFGMMELCRCGLIC